MLAISEYGRLILSFGSVRITGIPADASKHAGNSTIFSRGIATSAQLVPETASLIRQVRWVLALMRTRLTYFIK